jgi:hypothetical protein
MPDLTSTAQNDASVTVTLPGPIGHAATIFVGLPGLPIGTPIVRDDVWLDLNLLLVRTSGVPQVGAPLTFSSAPLRSIAALGVQLGWQAATFAARSGLQISNPTCQVAW